jgi:capsular exopolysaccharide synthesis family protein
MSRIFEALQKSNSADAVIRPEMGENASDLIHQAASPESVQLDRCPSFSIASMPQNRIVAVSDEHGLAAEKIRVLATKLRHLAARKPLKRLLVTSSMKGDGKSVVSANLAVTLAKSAKARILLIDGDLRQPTLAAKLGCNTEGNLADWWREDISVDKILHKEKNLPLWFLPAGQFSSQPLEVLQSQRLSTLVNDLSEMFDWIVIDSPPLVPLADSRVWASMADGVIIVVREKFTQVEFLNKSVEAIDSKKLLGLVMNDTTVSESKYYPAYYQYTVKKEPA